MKERREPKALEKLDTKLERAAAKRPLKTVALNFALLTVIVVAAMAYFSLSESTIVITAPRQEYILNETILAGIGKDIPLSALVEHDFSATQTFKSSDVTALTARTSGHIVIYNKSSKNQELRATTRFLTSNNILFRLNEYRNVPAGGQVEADITADKEGETYEIKPDEKLTLPALWPGLQSQIYGVGSAAHVQQDVSYAVGEDDVSNAKDALKNTLATQALEFFKKDVPSITNENIYVQDPVYTQDKKVGDQSATFSMTAKATVGMAQISRDDLKEFMSAKAAERVPDGKELDGLKQDSLTFSIDSYDTTSNIASLKANATALFKLSPLHVPIDKNKLVGLQKDAAVATIRSMIPDTKVDITFWPFWVRTMPSLTDHIKLRVNE